MDRAEIRELFQNIDFDRAAGKEEWSEQFLSLLRMGAEGKAGIENKEDFMTLLHGMLINESVYMPVLHVTLPFILMELRCSRKSGWIWMIRQAVERRPEKAA